MTATVTARNAVQLADKLNNMFESGNLTTVNGSMVVSRFGGKVARSWQNGTVSVTVKARAKGKTTDVFVKVGQALRAA